LNPVKDLPFLSATEIARRIRSREVSCLEVLESYIARAERYNPIVNAIVVKDFDRARARAKEADRAISRRDSPGPLHGVPMTIKEAFALAGTPTTFGLEQYRDNVANQNALAVDRLIAAGANIFGKTNVPPWLSDGQSANPLYGRTVNPWDTTRTPGGSSGGSAAALAAGITALEIGSDIASSIRNPAHFCGVFGHKPTYGICPARGHSIVADAQDADINCIGPLARGADDLELVLSVIAGPDAVHGSAYTLALPESSRRELKDFRVAVVLDDDVFEVDREIQAQLQALADFLAREGVEVHHARPAIDTRELFRLNVTLVRAATASRQTDEEYAAALARAKTTDLSRHDYATATLRGNTLSHREWLQLNDERHRLRRRWHEFFQDFDVLICPPAPSAAFPHKTEPFPERTLRVNGKELPYGDQTFWSAYCGIAYLPATVAPIGLTAERLPVGVQIIGPQYADLTCIHFARLLERHYYRFVAPSGYA
jgi:amidase